MEPIEVTARFNPSGKIFPLYFQVGDVRLDVHSLGRQWRTEEGTHVLVLDSRSRAYHLFFRREDTTWFRIRDLQPPGQPT